MTTNACSTSSCPYFLSIFNVAPQGWRSLFTSKMAKSPFTPNDYMLHFFSRNKMKPTNPPKKWGKGWLFPYSEFPCAKFDHFYSGLVPFEEQIACVLNSSLCISIRIMLDLYKTCFVIFIWHYNEAFTFSTIRLESLTRIEEKYSMVVAKQFKGTVNWYKTGENCLNFIDIF